MGEDNKTTHVFFHRDMDGLCCAFLVYDNLFRATPERNRKYKSVQYEEEINFSDVKEGDVVIFVDFTPSLEEAKRLFELKPYHIAILDHHPVKELHDRLDLLVRGRDIGMTCSLNTNARGAVAVVGEWLGLQMLDVLTSHVGRRDVWDFSFGDTKAINEGIGALAPFPNCDNEDAVLAWFHRYHELRKDVDKVREIGECLLEKMYKELDKLTRRATRFTIQYKDKETQELKRFRCLGVFSNEYISDMGNHLAEHSGEQKFAVVANFDIATLRLSFRSVDGHSAREKALLLGGGGHPDAAGASTEDYLIEHDTPVGIKITFL